MFHRFNYFNVAKEGFEWVVRNIPREVPRPSGYLSNSCPQFIASDLVEPSHLPRQIPIRDNTPLSSMVKVPVPWESGATWLAPAAVSSMAPVVRSKV